MDLQHLVSIIGKKNKIIQRINIQIILASLSYVTFYSTTSPSPQRQTFFHILHFFLADFTLDPSVHTPTAHKCKATWCRYEHCCRRRFVSLGVSFDQHGMTLEKADRSTNQNVKLRPKRRQSTSKKPRLAHQRWAALVFCSPTCPPAAQAATSPYWPPSFCSRCATVVTNLQPVAPNG